ncbi:MAG TPA: cytochrome C [Chloroflexi bacterium]|nr:cytochrome C [Chloroflexota bacterium]HHW85318.1 cytochrome c [Chloroflexota bacterium]
MLSRTLLLFILAVGLLLLLLVSALTTFGTPQPVVINGTAAPPLPTLNPAAVAEGERLYARYCASCHGANLEGAPDWKTPLSDGSLPPPPQDSSGHTWHHADSLLLTIIREGGAPTTNSKMPAFGEQLRDEEIEAILAFFKSRWGEEERKFQWWVTVVGGEQ